jgi:hypothetical protein
MNSFIIALLISIAVFSVLAVVFSATWVYKDAKARGLPAGLWAFLVVISSIFIGLILYVLIARKQNSVICNHCNMPTNQGTFCSRCGKEITQSDIAMDRVQPKAKMGLLIACITCISLVLILAATLVGTIILPNEGFIYVRSSSGYQHNFIDSTTGRGIRQRSSGETWEISFREASAGYTFTNFYRARTQPSSLALDVNYMGPMQLVVSQGNVTINEILTEGFHEFDMSAFTAGRLRIEIINIYAGTDYSAVLTIVR